MSTLRRAHLLPLVLVAACGPGAAEVGAAETGSSSTGETSTTASAGSELTGETPTTGEPEDVLVLCPFELSPIEPAPRTSELRFTDAQLRFQPAMLWRDGALLVSVVIEDDIDEVRRWGVGATVDAGAELSMLWELPPEAFPQAIVDTAEGALVVADAYHTDFVGGVLRLRPDGTHDTLVELPAVGVGVDTSHPISRLDGHIYARMFETVWGYHGRPARIPTIGGEIEAFDFEALIYGVVDGAAIGLDANFGPLGCEPDCLPPLVSLTLARHDLALAQTTVIASPICITGDADYVPSVTGGRTVRAVHVTADGLVIDEGALVEVGFDGSHRVIAAVEDGIEGAVHHDGRLYFVSGKTSLGRDDLSLRRVALGGGVVEELADFAESGELIITAFSETHVFVIHQDLERRALLRIPL